MNNEKRVAILKQRMTVASEQEKLARIVVKELKAWGDKTISKRLATTIQKRLDSIYGTEPLTKEQKESWWGENRDHWSNVDVSYTKEDSWSGEPRYTIKVYSRKLVEKFPDIAVMRDGKVDYYTPDQDNNSDVEVEAMLCADIEALISSFERYFDQGVSDYQKAIDAIEDIESKHKEVVDAIHKWHKYVDSFGVARYQIGNLFLKIDRGY